jgi:hypothetical protein
MRAHDHGAHYVLLTTFVFHFCRIRSCFTVWKQLAESNASSFLIFEDDVQFLDSMSQWRGYFNRIQSADPQVSAAITTSPSPHHLFLLLLHLILAMNGDWRTNDDWRMYPFAA